jgi:DNA-binding beta-propeller fold protein YncE
MYKYSITFFFLLAFSSCVKDKPGSPVQPQVQLTSTKKVYVINEGQFQNGGNGSISLYDPGNNSVIENFYEVQNQSQIGNIAQSLNYINGNFYIVVNNANKIIVCDDALKKTAQINGLTSPRYILPVTNEKAYVSDLYANAISIVDLNLNAQTGKINCWGKTEKMVLLYNKVFVTNTDRNYVYVINTTNDLIMDSVFVGLGAGSLVIDKNDRVWVLGSGNQAGSAGRLTKINPLTDQVESFLNFGSNDSPVNLCLNRTKDTLFFLNNNIYRMAISESALPATAFVENGSKNFYGLGVNPNDHTVYAADALDYSQQSHIYIYGADGVQRKDFKAGIISNGFYFE